MDGSDLRLGKKINSDDECLFWYKTTLSVLKFERDKNVYLYVMNLLNLKLLNSIAGFELRTK